MKISKKDDILKLYDEGFKVEDIVEKGFSKKYVKQVLKKLKLQDPIPVESTPLCTEPELKSDITELKNYENSNEEAINQLKEILILLENHKINSISIDISISLKKKEE